MTCHTNEVDAMLTVRAAVKKGWGGATEKRLGLFGADKRDKTRQDVLLLLLTADDAAEWLAAN